MEFFTPLPADTSPGLAMALVASSQAPLLLLDDDIAIVGGKHLVLPCVRMRSRHASAARPWPSSARASGTFRNSTRCCGRPFSGAAAIDAYEMDLVREGQEPAA